MTKEFEFSEMEPGKHDLQFHCEWAVFPKTNPGSSLCYVTSEERAEWISDRLNELLHLRSERTEAGADDVEAARDTERLNWLDKEMPLTREDVIAGTITLYAAHPSGKGASSGEGKTFREAIDKAMQALLSEHGVSSPVGGASSPECKHRWRRVRPLERQQCQLCNVFKHELSPVSSVERDKQKDLGTKP